MKFISFGSIKQFKEIITDVKRNCDYHQKPFPKLTYIGSTKLHGSNSGIIFTRKTQTIHCQSRERIITPFDDNMNFAKYVQHNVNYFTSLSKFISERYDCDAVAIFGEWAGKGIQKGVGINDVDKNMYVFEIKLIDQFDEEESEQHSIRLTPNLILDCVEDHAVLFNVVPPMHVIYDKTKFPVYEIEIDFANPIHAQNQLVELTNAVEAECPVAKFFGFSGIGEGIVWQNYDTNTRFKVKGSAHSATKVKTVKEIAAVDIEQYNSMTEFVSHAVSENRLNQGLAKLGEKGLQIESKNTGVFLKWIADDIIKEEIEAITIGCFDKKQLMPLVNAAAKKFWFAELNKIVESVPDDEWVEVTA